MSSHTHQHYHRSLRTAIVAAGVVMSMPVVAHAQLAGGAPKEEHLPVSDEVRNLRMLHVSALAGDASASAKEIIFDGRSRSATLEFSNVGDRPVSAEIQLLFANLDYPHDPASDKILFTKNWEKVFPRDTVVINPGPNDRFAGRWMQEIPTRLTLGPKEKKQVKISINPPANIPDGEYWARLVTIVRPPDPNRNKGKPKDERTIYSLPVKGQSPPMLRDSVQIFYRKGAMTMGAKFGTGAIAEIDTVGLPGPEDIGSGSNRLWFNLPIVLTGNMHFDGVLHVSYKNLGTGAVEALTPAPLIMYRSAVTHWWGQADKFGPGKYEIIVTLDAPQDGIPQNKRVQVTPATIHIPFEIRR